MFENETWILYNLPFGMCIGLSRFEFSVWWYNQLTIDTLNGRSAEVGRIRQQQMEAEDDIQKHREDQQRKMAAREQEKKKV